MVVDAIVVVEGVAGSRAGMESNVSHCVVMTTAPDVECLNDCCGRASVCIGKFPTKCLACSCWFGDAIFPFEHICCWDGNCCCGIWLPLLVGVEFLIFNTSRASTYFCTLLTFRSVNAKLQILVRLLKWWSNKNLLFMLLCKTKNYLHFPLHFHIPISYDSIQFKQLIHQELNQIQHILLCNLRTFRYYQFKSWYLHISINPSP